MTEDQSVVGRRRIYYDQNGGEALICSDSEEEAIDEEEEKREFIDSEDYILRFVYSNSLVVEVVFNCYVFTLLFLPLFSRKVACFLYYNTRGSYTKEKGLQVRNFP